MQIAVWDATWQKQIFESCLYFEEAWISIESNEHWGRFSCIEIILYLSASFSVKWQKMTVCIMVEEVWTAYGSCQASLVEDFRIRHVIAKSVVCLLIQEQRKKEICTSVTSYFLEHVETNENFLRLWHDERRSMVLNTRPSTASKTTTTAKWSLQLSSAHQGWPSCKVTSHYSFATEYEAVYIVHTKH
jgi:hypothetical protein